MAYFQFNQNTGDLLFVSQSTAVEEALHLGAGYSGKGVGKNNGRFEQIKDTGPIPKGIYVIGVPQNTDDHGPYVMKLTPKPENKMFGREGFLIHGDSLKKPGEASEGCIVLSSELRKVIGGSGYKVLQVIG